MDYAQQQRNPARHWLGLSFVALLHVVVIYALVNGLAHKIVDAVRKPIETVIVKENAPPPPPPAAPPPPKLDVPPPFVPPPDIPIAVPPPRAITQVVHTPPPVAVRPAPVRPAPVRPTLVVRTRPALDRSSCATTEPEYPMSSRRNMEAGTVVLRIEIGTNGLPAQVDIARSSGYQRLDVSARGWISSCRFRPAMVDGKPVLSWVAQAYTFTLQD